MTRITYNTDTLTSCTDTLTSCSTAWGEVERWGWGTPPELLFFSAAHGRASPVPHGSQATGRSSTYPQGLPQAPTRMADNVCMNRWWSKEEQEGVRLSRNKMGSQAACICYGTAAALSRLHCPQLHAQSQLLDTNSRPAKHPPSKMPGNQEVTGLQDSGEQPHCPPTADFIWLARPLHYWSSFSSDFPRSCGN